MGARIFVFIRAIAARRTLTSLLQDRNIGIASFRNTSVIVISSHRLQKRIQANEQIPV
jgi:hypothetical protein